jgi:hypothetical protein
MIFNNNCCSKIVNMAPAGKNGRLRDRGGGGRARRGGGSVKAGEGGGLATAERARPGGRRRGAAEANGLDPRREGEGRRRVEAVA